MALNNYTLDNNRGVAKRNLDDYQGAIADHSKAIQLCPFCSDSYYLRGLCEIDLGDKNNACLDFGKARELGDEEAYKQIKKHCK